MAKPSMASPAIADSGSDGSATSHDGMYRFNDTEIEQYNESTAGKRMSFYFFLLGAWFLWEWQTIMQAQDWLTMEFGDKLGKDVGTKAMICQTVPQLVTQVVLSLTGVVSKVSWRTRVVFPCTFMLLIAVFLIWLVTSDWEMENRLRAFYIASIVQSVVNSLMEPALYEMAGLLPSTRGTEMMQVGIAASGLLVSVVQAGTRLILKGAQPLDKDDSRQLLVVFLTFAGMSAVGMVVLFLGKVERNPAFRYISNHDAGGDAQSSATGELEMTDMGEAAGQPGPAVAESPTLLSGQGDAGFLATFRENWANTREALNHIWPSAIALALVFWGTLTMFPVIPGSACVRADPESTDDKFQDWQFMLVMLAYNLGDVIGRGLRTVTEWGAKSLTPCAQVAAALVRAVLLMPLIIFSSAPQMYNPLVARWIIMAGTLAVGVTNGCMSTICFMRAPKALPPSTTNGVAAQASSVLTIGLFLGIALGCITADRLIATNGLLSDSLNVCYAPPQLA